MIRVRQYSQNSQSVNGGNLGHGVLGRWLVDGGGLGHGMKAV